MLRPRRRETWRLTPWEELLLVESGKVELNGIGGSLCHGIGGSLCRGIDGSLCHGIGGSFCLGMSGSN